MRQKDTNRRDSSTHLVAACCTHHAHVASFLLYVKISNRVRCCTRNRMVHNRLGNLETKVTAWTDARVRFLVLNEIPRESTIPCQGFVEVFTLGIENAGLRNPC